MTERSRVHVLEIASWELWLVLWFYSSCELLCLSLILSCNEIDNYCVIQLYSANVDIKFELVKMILDANSAIFYMFPIYLF